MSTQTERLKEYLNKYKSITQIEALNELGIFRLASRISDLKREGFDISGKMITVHNRFGDEIRVKKYFLN